jgi:hypothetical protein
MAKFLVIHTLPSPVSFADAEPMGKASKALSNTNAYWVGAWVQLDDKGNVSRIICEWDAKDAESILKILKQIPGLPIDGPYPMMKLEGESYR